MKPQAHRGPYLPPLKPPSELAEFLTSGAVLLFVVVAIGLLWLALT